jgi:hypothetical protein
MRLHHLVGFGIAERAVLDRIHAQRRSADDGVAPVGMGGHAHAKAVRGVDDGADLRVGHQRVVGIVPDAQHAAAGHDLDEIDAVAVHPPDDLGRLVRAIDDAAFAMEIKFRAHAVLRIAMAAGGAERIARNPQPRPRDLAPGDGALQRDDNAGFAADIAHGGEAGFQRLAREAHGIEGGIEVRMRHPLGDRVLAGIGRGDVIVHVDQAGQDGGRRKIDDVRAGGRDEPVLDAGDAIIVNQDRDVVARLRADPVDQMPGVDHQILRHGRGGEQGENGGCGRGGQTVSGDGEHGRSLEMGKEAGRPSPG